MSSALSIPIERLADFCRRRRIVELSLFGSSARGEAGPFSDVDVLVTFDPAAQIGLLDVEDARLELCSLFGRSVDLIERPVLEKHHNPWLKSAILGEARTVYRAAA